MAGKLTVHRGAKVVTWDELRQYPVPTATETWKPVSHIELVETLAGVMADRGLHVTREQFAVQGPRLFGVFDTEWQKMEDYGAAVGFRHGISRDVAIHILCGARVWLCDNLSYSGEQITVRKHTAKLNLAEEMDRALYRYMQGFRKFQERIQFQKDCVIDDRKIKTLIYDIFSQRIVPLRLFPYISEHYANIRKNNQVLTTGWWLHNTFTATAHI
jgi:hypothetical protein